MSNLIPNFDNFIENNNDENDEYIHPILFDTDVNRNKILLNDKLEKSVEYKALDIDTTKKKKSKSKIKNNDNPEDVNYSDTYTNTNAILNESIINSNQLLFEIKQDIETIRHSKTLKNKYTYITNLASSAASLISTSINAAKELNNSITQSHNLELKRRKDNNDAKLNDKNDDAKMMDMYNAFIKAPVDMYSAYQAPTIDDMMFAPNSQTIGNAVPLGTSEREQLSPEQVRIRMEDNPNIEEIIRYDESSGRKWFDVVDVRTGKSVPNYPKSDPFLLEDTKIDLRAKVGRNRNLDRVWQVVTSDSEVIY